MTNTSKPTAEDLERRITALERLCAELIMERYHHHTPTFEAEASPYEKAIVLKGMKSILSVEERMVEKMLDGSLEIKP